MSKFNSTTLPTTATVNRARGVAVKQSDELALASLLLTSFLTKQSYRTAKQSQNDLVDLIAKVDPYFAAQAAIYARNEFGMRSVSHVVAGEIASALSGKEWAKNFYSKVCFRPDDVTEILSYVGARPTHAMAKGLRIALERFDDYQLGKYKSANKSIKLVDAVNITHAHSDSITKLVNGTLTAPETFETKLSAAGKKENVNEAKEDAWRDLLENRKIGYLALLRNLRNIADQAPELTQIACDLLVDEKLIQKSKVFPFQYLTAYQELHTNREYKRAITRAVDISCRNVPKFDGRTLIALDVSGSMRGKPEHIGSLFSAVMYKAMNADFVTFDDKATYITPNPDDSTITIAESIPFRAGGTAFSSIFDLIGQKHYDRIFILSDMQSWIETASYWNNKPVKQCFNDYKKVNPEVRLYSFDLTGYGDMQFPERNVYCVAGFSDKVFDVIAKLESGTSLVQQIKQVEI